MSRTDKDEPARVRAVEARTAEAWHVHCESSDYAAHLLRRGVELRSCDLGRPAGWCRWMVEERDRYYPTRPTKADRRAFYYGPERAAVRAVLARARAEFRGAGEVDVEPPVRQHRRGVWAGGWWD